MSTSENRNAAAAEKVCGSGVCRRELAALKLGLKNRDRRLAEAEKMLGQVYDLLPVLVEFGDVRGDPIGQKTVRLHKRIAKWLPGRTQNPPEKEQA